MNGKVEKKMIGNKLLYEEGNISFNDNEIILLIGRNGTGKTTLLEQLYKQNFNNGIYVAQDNDWLLENGNILDNILMGQPEKEQLVVLLKQLNCESLLEKKVTNICGGEKKIICLLRGLLSDAKIVFLDEPTNDLDYRTVNELIQIFREHSRNKVLVIVTHDERLFACANHIYCIDEQKIKEVYRETTGNPKITNDRRSIGYNKAFFARVLKKDYFPIVSAVVLLGLTLFSFFYVSKGIRTLPEHIPQNQVNICNTLYASPQKLIEQGYIPISLLKYFGRENFGILNILDEIESFEEIEAKAYSLGLNIEKTINYEVYNTYLYDVNRDAYIDVINEYEEYLNNNRETLIENDVFGIDSFYYEWRGIENEGNTIEIDAKTLKKCEEVYRTINGESLLENCLCIVRLNPDYSFSEFAQENSILDMDGANYYVKSNETIQVLETLKYYKLLKESIEMYLLFIILFVLVEILNLNVHRKLLKKDGIVFRNYGFSKEVVNNLFISKYTYGRKFVLGIILIVIFSVILVTRFQQKSDFFECIFLIIYGMWIGVCDFMKKASITNLINDIYYFRGEDSENRIYTK